ncbi:MAG: TIGR01777 family oxidoreductase [Halioglobus sp.]
MQILVTGGTGFIGSALVPSLVAAGHELIVLTRQTLPNSSHLRYVTDLAQVAPDTAVNAVINLAGASLAGRRWNERYKAEIVNSRMATTRALLDWIESRQQRPEVLLSASAIGYYGHQGDDVLDEAGHSVPGFSQDLCDQWETLAERAVELGVRTCQLRLGVVLDSGGGAFQQMVFPFKLGVGNWVGSGKQWFSWIHRADVVQAMSFLLGNADCSGAYNLTAPEPVTSRDFSAAIGRQRRLWISLPMPAALMRLALGEMAEELLINGQRVVPKRLEAAGFEFQYPSLDSALTDIMSG